MCTVQDWQCIAGMSLAKYLSLSLSTVTLGSNPLTIHHQTRRNCLGAVRLTKTPTMLAVETDIHHRLHAASVSDLPVFDIAAHFHNNASAFVTRRVDPEFTHCRHRQVFEHVVQIGVADTCGVKPEEDFIWAFGRTDVNTGQGQQELTGASR